MSRTLRLWLERASNNGGGKVTGATRRLGKEAARQTIGQVVTLQEERRIWFSNIHGRRK